MGPYSKPWAVGTPQVGTYYLPIVMQAWTKSARDGGRPFMLGVTLKEQGIAANWSGVERRAPQGTSAGAQCSGA